MEIRLPTSTCGSRSLLVVCRNLSIAIRLAWTGIAHGFIWRHGNPRRRRFFAAWKMALRGSVDLDSRKTAESRKRHVLIGIGSLPLQTILHAAGAQDRDGCALAMTAASGIRPLLPKLSADAGLRRQPFRAGVNGRTAQGSRVPPRFASGTP
jgi:hypothetical protein